MGTPFTAYTVADEPDALLISVGRKTDTLNDGQAAAVVENACRAHRDMLRQADEDDAIDTREARDLEILDELLR